MQSHNEKEQAGKNKYKMYNLEEKRAQENLMLVPRFVLK